MNRVVTVCGLNIVVREGTCDHDVANSVLYQDEYQLRNHAIQGGTFADIGAYCGHASLFLAILGMTGVALEPLPQNVAMVASNLELNGQRERVKIVEGCLGSDKVYWNYSTALENQYRFMGNGFGDVGGGASPILVKNVSLEELLEPFDHIDILKTDCEGGEWALVDSPAHVLSKIDLIIGEFHPVLGDYDKFIGTVHGFEDVSAKFHYPDTKGMRLFALKRL